jgi:hypothetical protein
MQKADSFLIGDTGKNMNRERQGIGNREQGGGKGETTRAIYTACNPTEASFIPALPIIKILGIVSSIALFRAIPWIARSGY